MLSGHRLGRLARGLRGALELLQFPHRFNWPKRLPGEKSLQYGMLPAQCHCNYRSALKLLVNCERLHG